MHFAHGVALFHPAGTQGHRAGRPRGSRILALGPGSSCRTTGPTAACAGARRTGSWARLQKPGGHRASLRRSRAGEEGGVGIRKSPSKFRDVSASQLAQGPTEH